MQKDEDELNLVKKVVPPHLNPESKILQINLIKSSLAMKREIDPTSLKLGARDALEYVSWLVQPNKLFDVALTTYDFDLVTLVAT